MQRALIRYRVSWALALSCSMAACNSGRSASPDPEGIEMPPDRSVESEDPADPKGPVETEESEVVEPAAPPTQPSRDWLRDSTVSLRNRVAVPSGAAHLDAAQIVDQLKRYDPGSVLRCQVQDDPAYSAAVDSLGGVSWGYHVQLLEDTSQPQFRRGLPAPAFAASGANSGGSAVEIEEADIVGMSERAALFYSTTHGLLLVDLSGATPRFTCAVKLPGQVKNFFYYRDHLIAMTGPAVLHFKVQGTNLQFIEKIALPGDVLDTRRFNDRLVIYSRLALAQQPGTAAPTPSFSNGVWPPYQDPHRALHVFAIGDTLKEELSQTLLDTSPNRSYLESGGIAEGTQPGTVVHTASAFQDALWASDHYFVVTERVDTTKLASWATRTYPLCVESHLVERPYTSCWTNYEARPNPDYVPPDNSGGDRACKGTTLADCLHQVARVSNPTIQVPVGTTCREDKRVDWYCDRYETRSYTYPYLEGSVTTRLNIFEYTPSGFVRLDSKVREITTQNLDALALEARVPTLTTSSEAYDLSIPGALQTLQFQNGFLYAVADGVLQVYAMGANSLVRTSSLTVANQGLQASLFSGDRLYLSDFGYHGSNDYSTLRVVDLSNGAFPRQISQDRSLPGGHSRIIPTRGSILTVGSVQNFQGVASSVLKLGLFDDPFTSEKAYLFLGTDLAHARLGEAKSQHFDAAEQRMFLPYAGRERDRTSLERARIGISHLAQDEIVTEGALAMPEPIQRVRPRSGVAGELLAFGNSSVSWLRGGDEWRHEPLLAYYTPIALYRRSDAEDYVEVSRLGSSCRLRAVKAAALNARSEVMGDEAFECGVDWPTAYADYLVFGRELGVHFDAAGHVQPLSTATVADILDKQQKRTRCLLSLEKTDKPLDFDQLPPASAFTCYDADAYAELLRN